MAKSTQLIKDYLAAGFRKIHIDTSMPCLDDPATGLKLSSAARRTVELCSVAEQAARSNPQYPKPVYVIGSEVPSPGGAAEAEESIKVTEMRAAAQTLELFAREFAEAGLQEAWERVFALVVQPGVEFGDEHILAYDRSKCEALLGFIQQVPGIVFEAHSTDYQPAVALRQMVEDQFAVLKVGPALTFAYRQVMLAMEDMEQTWLGRRSEVNLSRLKQTLLEAMREEPVHWENYYHGSSQEVEFKQIYSYSDRIRYYWRASEIQTALQRLLANLRQFPPPLPLVSQYLPVQWAHIQNGALGLDPQDWIWDGVQSAWSVYVAACHELSGR
jgi:D-tagatose-1,6-bisphosphate aldolase subunit GatZ/KbaZ